MTAMPSEQFSDAELLAAEAQLNRRRCAERHHRPDGVAMLKWHSPLPLFITCDCGDYRWTAKRTDEV